MTKNCALFDEQLHCRQVVEDHVHGDEEDGAHAVANAGLQVVVQLEEDDADDHPQEDGGEELEHRCLRVAPEVDDGAFRDLQPLQRSDQGTRYYTSMEASIEEIEPDP